MKTKHLIFCSAVTVVTTGLTLLSSGTSEAHGRNPSGMRMSANRGGMNNGAIHQSITNRALNRGRGIENVSGRTSGAQSLNRGRDDRGDRHERGDDRGRNASITRGERERGDDHGRHRERGDDRGRDASVTRGERERGDDHGRHHERGDDRGRDASVTRGERERGDDHGRHHERGDDNGTRL